MHPWRDMSDPDTLLPDMACVYHRDQLASDNRVGIRSFVQEQSHAVCVVLYGGQLGDGSWQNEISTGIFCLDMEGVLWFSCYVGHTRHFLEDVLFWCYRDELMPCPNCREPLMNNERDWPRHVCLAED